MSFRPSEEEGLYGWRPNSELSTLRLVCLMIAEKRETLSCATSTWPVRVLLCTNSMSWALCRESSMTQLVWFDHRGSRICTCKWNTAIDWQNDSPYGPFLVRQIHGTLQCTSKKPKCSAVRALDNTPEIVLTRSVRPPCDMTRATSAVLLSDCCFGCWSHMPALLCFSWASRLRKDSLQSAVNGPIYFMWSTDHQDQVFKLMCLQLLMCVCVCVRACVRACVCVCVCVCV